MTGHNEYIDDLQSQDDDYGISQDFPNAQRSQNGNRQGTTGSARSLVEAKADFHSALVVKNNSEDE